MPEFKIEINDFQGKNLKADPLDMDHHESQTLDGFDVSTKPGALVKRKGYTDQADVILPSSYPSSWTIKNFFQFRATKPSAQNIIMVHATVGGEDRIYIDYTYNGSSWVQGWVELTEQEEGLAADAGTNTTTIIDAGLSSAANDYYNGWYVYNWTRLEGALVSDYVGGTTTITLMTAITGQTTGDSYSIFRFPLAVNVEADVANYVTGTGTSTTQIHDLDDPDTKFYQLNRDFDDAYNGWTVWNTGTDGNDSYTDTISDYQASYAGNKQRLIHGAIATQTDGDEYSIYKPTRVFTVDDKIAFRQRPSATIMSLGNAARYPEQYPMWYGFLRDTYYFGSSTNNISDGYYLEPQVLDAPHDSVFSCTRTPAGDIGITDNVYVACAYQYDGYQIGPMTTTNRAFFQVITSTDGADDVTITFNVGYSAEPNMRFGRTLNKRVTGIVVYAATDLDTSSKTATWHRLVVIPIREDYGVTSVFNNFSKTSAQEIEAAAIRRGETGKRATITPSGRVNRKLVHTLSTKDWTGSDPYARTFVIDGGVWANKSDYYSLDSGGMNGDKIGYSYGADSINNNVIAKLFIDKSESSLIAATPMKDDGTPSPDWFPLLNAFDLANHGITNIYGIKMINDFVYVFGSSKSIRLLLKSGLVPGFKSDTEYDFLGTEAPHGIEKFKNRIAGVFKSGIHILGNGEELISYPIEDTTNYPIGVTDLTEAYLRYYPLRKELWAVFPTDKLLYSYDFIRKQWAVHTLGAGINSLVVGEDNELYGASTGKIFKMDNGTTDDSTSINPQWKSKVYSMGRNEGVLNDVEITYKSDTIIQFDVYINRGSAESWATSGDNQFAVATSATTTKLKFPNGFRGGEFEFGLSIPSANRAANTYVEIYKIVINGIVEERQ
jgi:hypothetical protein